MKIKAPKKLIEVALPLDEINEACIREKSIRHGHPSTLHLYWARRPLAAARAVLFAQMVNDPGGERGYMSGKTKAQAAEEREELFSIIRDLVKWENTNNESVLNRAKEEIWKSWRQTCALNKGKAGFDPEKLPAFHDPFAGGGAIPLEAQRLGLESYASDLNPVAVLINKAMIEIPPKFANRAPVGPIPVGEQISTDNGWTGARGLAEDVRRYGMWMREEAYKKIGKYYPPVEITEDMVNERPDLKPYLGKKLTVIAWLWARTVKSPNPQFSDVDVPLVSSFAISKKKGHEAYVEPIIHENSYEFKVRMGKVPAELENGTTMGKRKGFFCLMSNIPIGYDYVRAEGTSGRMSSHLMAIVAEGKNERVYLSPTSIAESIAKTIPETWIPTTALPDNTRDFKTPLYGLTTFGDLFTKRQLLALNTFSDLLKNVREKIISECNYPDKEEYANAIITYLAFVIDKCTDYWSSICTWHSAGEKMRNTFGRQAIPMSWDYAECNVFSHATGNMEAMLDWVFKAIITFPQSNSDGFVDQADAQIQNISDDKVISTDPPYYDNIGYADLSDFFYVWLKKALGDIYPNLFATIATPKSDELIAVPYRHGNSKKEAADFFLDGMTVAMRNLANRANPAFPVTIYYAFKASETSDSQTSNTGWETFLEAVIRAGFSITGTWPMRTELANKLIGIQANVLASSIVIVCRKRDDDAEEVSRNDFVNELNAVMPEALRDMLGLDGVSSPIAPVDLAQAAIGPGMEIFSKYKSVLNQDGTRMSVHDAMILINKSISDYLNPDMGDFDPQTLFCNEWFKIHTWGESPFGEADTLARAKGTSVSRISDSGVLNSKGGKVSLIHWKDYPEDYDPTDDKNLPTWEACHHMIRVLVQNGETGAGELLSKMAPLTEKIRQLAYHLYTLCERSGNAEDARYYNMLITSWSSIELKSMEFTNISKKPKQDELSL